MGALTITPRTLFKMTLGEECQYSLDVSAEVGTKTVDSFAYKLFGSANDDVTTTMSGGSSISDNIILFGVKASSAGKHRLEFIVTCADVLPDGVTPYEFYVNMYVYIS